MGRPLSLVIILSVLSGAMAFLGTLLTAPSQVDFRAFGEGVRRAAVDGNWTLVTNMSRQAVRNEPRFQEAMLFRGFAEDRLGSATRARHIWERLESVTRENMRRGNASAIQWHFLGWALRGRGLEDEARVAWRRGVEELTSNDDPYNRVCLLALAGEAEAAIAAWEALVEGRITRELITWAKVDPDLEGIRSDPRFEAARERAWRLFTNRVERGTAI